MISASCLAVLVAIPPQDSAPAKYSYAAAGYPGFGTIVGRAGDVNGDGVPDVVLGDPGHAENQIPAAFWIVSGKDGSVLHRIVLPEEKSSTFVLDGGADLDGDGVPDLLIAAHPLVKEGRGCGGIYLVSGKTGSVLRRIAIGGTWMGDWARFISDVDHDGIADVGVLNLDSSARGALLSLYSGRTGAVIVEIPIENECGAINGGFIEVDDLDGDGRRDFAVLLDGTTDRFATLRTYSAARKTKLWEHRAPRSGGGTYCRLLMLSDLDGDGVHELAVSFSDCVEVILGKTGGMLYRLEPPDKRADSSTGYGWALAGLGNADGSGYTNLAIAEPEGRINGIVRAFSGKTANKLWETCVDNDDGLYTFGWAMAALGDINGDKVSDLIVGCWGGVGQARAIAGENGALIYEFMRKGDDVIVTRRAASVEKPR